MGMVIGDNFNYQGKKPLDSRMLFDTIADMKAYSENYLPDITLAFNKEDSKMYVFNRTNDVDTTTGKWREFESDSAIAVEDLTNYNEYENRVEEQYMVMKRNITTQKWDKLPENSLQDKNGTYSFNNYDVAGKYWFNNCVVSDGHPAMLNLDGQGKVHGVLEVFESYVYNQGPLSQGGIVFQRFTTTNSGQQLQFTRRKAFGHNGTWGAWTMEQTNRQSVNRGKTYAFFGGSVCYNWNPLSGTAADNYAIEEILGVNSIRKRAISGAGWVAGNKIDNQITTELAEANPADVWVFWSSTNDHTAQAPIGDLDHKTDTTTVIGAMCNAIERVRTAKPTANILMTTPIRRFNNESGWNPYYNDGTTIPFYKYAEAVYTVANYYGIPVFDLWNNSGIDIKNYTTYMSDTIHPKASGYALFSRELCKFCADGHNGNSMPVMKNTLVDLDDTNITNPTDGQVLSYNSTSEKWENKEVEADSSNVSYRGMSVEQALDMANPLVENLINEDTEMVNGFWQLDGQSNPEFNPATSGSLSDFVSFYIPVTEGETLYISNTMNNLWCAYLDVNKQPLYVGQFNGSTVTIPTGQNIAYFSYPTRYGYLPVSSITRTPAQWNGSVDVYRMNGSGETKMDYPSAVRNNNTYATTMAVETTPTVWRADYTYDFDNNVFGMGNGFYVLGVNTVDKTAIALNMNTKIFIFDIGLGTFVEGTYEVPEEWQKIINERKSPSRFCGCTRADDENNYILRSEGLSDLIIPKADIKTFVESNGKVFNNYTSASGMVYFYGTAAYKYMSIYSVRHKGPLVEKKSEVEADNHWANKTWYAYGTSMTDTTMNGYTVELQALLGANLTNYGKGGSGIIPSLHGGTSGDNTYTRVKRTTDGKTNADLITLEIIPNDMSGTLGTPTDNYADGTTETFCGCLNELLQYLQVNTNAQIVVLIATKSRYQYQHPETTYPPESENATKWIQWTDAAKECCRRNCVPFIDGQSNCGLGYARVSGNNRYVQDQIHLTPLGAKNLGQYFYSQIKNIPLFYSA